MSRLMNTAPSLPVMSCEDVWKVSRLEAKLRKMETVPIQTTHHFHAGLYSRTIRIPKGVVLTGSLMKIPTLLIVSGGHVTVFGGGEPFDLVGYNVLPGSAGRKQVFIAYDETDLTMIFPTQAKTVEEAEAEFTDETKILMSREMDGDVIIFTGE